MTPAQMWREFRRGCSSTEGRSPWRCGECRYWFIRALIKGLLRAPPAA